jgi:hypothetical protein
MRQFLVKVKWSKWTFLKKFFDIENGPLDLFFGFLGFLGFGAQK